MRGKYQAIRLVRKFMDQNVSRQQAEKAVTEWILEDVEGQAEEIVHFASEGFKRPSRNGKNRPRRGREDTAH